MLSVSGLLIAVALTYTGGLQGTGDTKSPLYISIVSQIVVPLGICFVIQQAGTLDPIDIWVAIFIGHATRCALSVLRFNQGKWRQIAVDLGGEPEGAKYFDLRPSPCVQLPVKMACLRLISALMLLGLAGTGTLIRAQEAPPPQGKSTLVYIGTHTSDKAKGIYLFRLQSAGTEVFQNVTLVPLGVAAETPNPTFFEADPQRRLLFAVNEVDQFEGKPGGAVSAFAIGETGKLTLINQRSSMGAAPCQLVTAAEGKYLVVANCADGSVAVLPVAADGQLGAATDVVKGVKAGCVTTDPARPLRVRLRAVSRQSAGVSDRRCVWKASAAQPCGDSAQGGCRAAPAGVSPRRALRVCAEPQKFHDHHVQLRHVDRRDHRA